MTVIRGRTGFPGACFVYNYRRSSDLSSTVSPGVIHFSFGDSVGRINVKDIYGDDHTAFWTLFAENGGVLSLRNETGRFYTTSVTLGTLTNGIVTLNFNGPFDARLVNNEVYINAAANGSEGSGGNSSISGTTATSLTGYLKGNGSVVSTSTGLPATDLTGTVADARLSDNVPLKNTQNTFTQSQKVENNTNNILLTLKNNRPKIQLLNSDDSLSFLIALDDNRTIVESLQCPISLETTNTVLRIEDDVRINTNVIIGEENTNVVIGNNAIDITDNNRTFHIAPAVTEMTDGTGGSTSLVAGLQNQVSFGVFGHAAGPCEVRLYATDNPSEGSYLQIGGPDDTTFKIFHKDGVGNQSAGSDRVTAVVQRSFGQGGGLSHTMRWPIASSITQNVTIDVPNRNGTIALNSASGGIVPNSHANSIAESGTIYYSTDAGKLVFKDFSGVVHDLY